MTHPQREPRSVRPSGSITTTQGISSSGRPSALAKLPSRENQTVFQRCRGVDSRAWLISGAVGSSGKRLSAPKR